MSRRPQTKTGPKDGRAMEEQQIIAGTERLLEAFKKAARRNGWMVREDWA